MCVCVCVCIWQQLSPLNNVALSVFLFESNFLIQQEDGGLTSSHDSKRIKDFAEPVIFQVSTKALLGPPCLCSLMWALSGVSIINIAQSKHIY